MSEIKHTPPFNDIENLRQEAAKESSARAFVRMKLSEWLQWWPVKFRREREAQPRTMTALEEVLMETPSRPPEISSSETLFASLTLDALQTEFDAWIERGHDQASIFTKQQIKTEVRILLQNLPQVLRELPGIYLRDWPPREILTYTLSKSLERGELFHSVISHLSRSLVMNKIHAYISQNVP